MDRPLLQRSDTTREFAAQRRGAIKRDGSLCHFERWVKSGQRWKMCLSRATDTAHIYPRRECGGAAAHVNVVLRACRKCHNAFDGHPDDDRMVRAPLDREAKAFKLISMASKVPVPRRKPPARPERAA